MKNKLVLIAMGIALSTQTLLAQVPSYVPTNGLVGYWPFNGNANDESGNGNNGTVNGATLTTDRFGNQSSAYSFNGISDNIRINNATNLNNPSVSVSGWFFTNTNATDTFYGAKSIIGKYWDSPSNCNSNYNSYIFCLAKQNNNSTVCLGTSFYSGNNFYYNQSISIGNWYHFTFVHDSISGGKIYINGQLVVSNTIGGAICSGLNPIYVGADIINGNLFRFFNGKIDDIGIWNRALSQQEITNLYNSASTNECLTMVINTGALNTNPVTYTSTVNIYPNPANDHITIDCGNLANVQGWSIKITNMLGQEVFNQPMNTQQYNIPLNSWTGQGMYFVKIINAQNEVVNIKKIILQ